MSSTGRTIRSAKMNATTPPKLMPPFHSTAASGTLPIEQTNETTETSGPTSGPHSLAASGWPSRNKPCQNPSGTQAASAPATSRPMAMSAQTEAQSITKYWLVAVNPSGERSRDQSEPPATAMSMPAWPSMRPATPRSAWRRAAVTSRGRSVARNTSASSTIISGPPTNSATVNCQPTSTARMMPSSITRLVEANWKAIAAVKSAPLRKIDLASATAAYEHDEDAAPSPPARQSQRGESSGSSRLISLLETTACTAPDRAKPRISAHRISQNIANASPSAWPMGASMVTSPVAGRPSRLPCARRPTRLEQPQGLCQRDANASALVLVEELLHALVVHVVLGDHHEAGADLLLDGLALEGGDRLLHPVLADVGRLLGDQRLDDPLLQVLDLLGPGVEADDLDLLGRPGAAHAGGGALGGEQVGAEDADQVAVGGQRGGRLGRGLLRLVVGVLDPDVLQPRGVLDLLLEALGAGVGGGDARLDVDHQHRALAAGQLGEGPRRLAAALLVVRGDLRLGELLGVLGGGVDEHQLDPGLLGLGERRDHRLGIRRGDQDRVRLLGHHRAEHRRLQRGVELVRRRHVQGGAEALCRLPRAALHGDVELVALDALDQGQLVLLLATATASRIVVAAAARRARERERDQPHQPTTPHAATSFRRAPGRGA